MTILHQPVIDSSSQVTMVPRGICYDLPHYDLNGIFRASAAAGACECCQVLQGAWMRTEIHLLSCYQV